MDFSVFAPHKLGELFSYVESTEKLFWAILYLLLGISVGMAKLFIICSGYGLYSSHLRKKLTLKEFYYRRAMRILPLYWAALALNFFMYPMFNPEYSRNMHHSIKALAYHFFLIHGYSIYKLYFGALWFIGYIAQFYLLFPILVRLYPVLNRWAMLALSFLVAYLSVKFFSSIGFAYASSIPTLFLPLFLFGMVMADIAHEGGRLERPFSLIAIYPLGAAISAVLVLFLVDLGTIGFSVLVQNVFYILVFIALFPASSFAFRFTASYRMVLMVSCASYVVFLVHQPITRLILKRTDILTSVPANYQPAMIVLLFALLTIPAYFIQKRYNYLAGRVRSGKS
jgi:peptidoglycan/LPS O-acetylase OafA/YrhL